MTCRVAGVVTASIADGGCRGTGVVIPHRRRSKDEELPNGNYALDAFGHSGSQWLGGEGELASDEVTTRRFAGRRVVVTGGSRGLGEQVVRLLISEGARVAVCARTPEDLDVLRSSVRSEGALFTRTLDVIRPEAMEEFVRDAAV